MRQSKTILAIGGLLVVLTGGWFVFSQAATPVQAGNLDTADVRGSGNLDGMTFSAELGPLANPPT